MKRFQPDDLMFAITCVIMVACVAFALHLTNKEIKECRVMAPMSLLPADCRPLVKPKAGPNTPPASGTVPDASTIGSESPRQE